MWSISHFFLATRDVFEIWMKNVGNFLFWLFSLEKFIFVAPIIILVILQFFLKSLSHSKWIIQVRLTEQDRVTSEYCPWNIHPQASGIRSESFDLLLKANTHHMRYVLITYKYTYLLDPIVWPRHSIWVFIHIRLWGQSLCSINQLIFTITQQGQSAIGDMQFCRISSVGHTSIFDGISFRYGVSSKVAKNRHCLEVKWLTRTPLSCDKVTSCECTR